MDAETCVELIYQGTAESVAEAKERLREVVSCSAETAGREAVQEEGPQAWPADHDGDQIVNGDENAPHGHSESWVRDFLACGGLSAILNTLVSTGRGGATTHTTTMGAANHVEKEPAVAGVEASLLQEARARMECLECLKAVMGSRDGVEYMIGSRETDLVKQLTMELDCNDILLKMNLFLLLSAICKHSQDGLEATMTALDHYKMLHCLRHRYSVLVHELISSTGFPEYQASILAFINYTLSALGGLDARMKMRSELSALQLPDLLHILKYSTTSECLNSQLRLYEKQQVADEEKLTVPGGIDVKSHEDLFRALFEKVNGTPQSACLLRILQALLQVEASTARGDAVWHTLERIADTAVSMMDPSQAERFYLTATDKLKLAVEGRSSGPGASGGGTADARAPPTDTPAPPTDSLAPPTDSPAPPTDSSAPPTVTPAPPSDMQTGSQAPSASPGADTPAPASADASAPPPPGPPAPPPPAPPPPPPGPLSVVGNVLMGAMNAVLSIFDKARNYKPKKRMKKLNWEKVPTCDAQSSVALWHGACIQDPRVKVTVDEEHLEILFCQKGTSAKSKTTSKELHLPNRQKALNVNIALDQIKRPVDDIVAKIREGDSSIFTLTQATILVDQSPDDKDIGFLKQFENDSSLASVEKFLYNLLQLSHYSMRLDVVKLKIFFEDIMEEFEPSFLLFHKAVDELMNSASLRELFYIILLIGNLINGGTRQGNAYGFRIASLERLSATLANVNQPNVNVIHYLVAVCKEESPNLLNFYAELPNLESASRQSVAAIQEDIDEWKKKIDALKEAVEDKEDPLSEDLKQQLLAFFPVADDKLERLYAKLASVKHKGKKAAEYFCDDRSDFLEKLFPEMREFAIEFKKIVKETEKSMPITVSARVKPAKGDIKAKDIDKEPAKSPQVPHLNRAVSIITEAHISFSELIVIHETEETVSNGGTSHEEEVEEVFSLPASYSTVAQHMQARQLFSRQLSYDPSGPLGRGSRPNLQRRPSLDPKLLFSEAMSDVAKVLNKMALAIEDDLIKHEA